MHHQQARRASGAAGGRRVHRADTPWKPEALQPVRTHLVWDRQLRGQGTGNSSGPTTQRLEENAFCGPLRVPNRNGICSPLRGPRWHLQGAKSSMRNVICTPEGAINHEFGCFLAPSGCPFIDIYQAGAQRTLGAVAPPLLPVTLSALSTLHRTTRAVTGSALPRLKTQAWATDHTLGARLNAAQWNGEQLRRAIHPGRALRGVSENHQRVSNVHHHRSRWASKPATGARCHRSIRALIGGDRGNRRRVVVGLRRDT